ncbi:Sedlin [Aspergillus taichungensis]|uniref:Sedlin n=1 Tax=Aspergillus taichungensis TaxID=482145 RepID=A0A2J5HFK0_9EURO|nr:Sedlin [Aspergillus taichungensis]
MPEPRIACIGVIGKADNPLHISLFPPYGNHNIDFSFILNSCLDIFEIRQKQTSIDQDLGLLYAMDERLAAYGWLTTTGVKFLVIIDLLGQSRDSEVEGTKGINGPTVKESDLKPVFRCLQTAYIRLLQNPFYFPDAHNPISKSAFAAPDVLQITDKKFVAEVKRIGESWVPGVSSL